MSAAIDIVYTQLPHLLLRLSALALLAAASIVTVNYIRVLSLRRHLPPGPFPLPIIGNHYRIPHTKPWIKFEEWSRRYDNPIITIWLGSRPVIVLNDAWTASEMLDKRADIYSSRPRLVAMGDLVNATETNQTTLVYGDRWRLHRKLTHSVVGSHAVRNYQSSQSDEAKILTLDLLEHPEDYVMSIERYSVSQVSIIGWGRRIARKNDYVAQKALEGMEAVNLVIPGYLLLESLPILASLPAWLYRLPSQLRAHSSALWAYFYALSQEAAGADGSPHASFSRTLLALQPGHALSDVEVAALTTNLVGGGVDTTSSTVVSAILALAAFPAVQAAAHAELDAADAANLPYTQALVTEVLRWRTVTVLGGIPHAPVRDDVFRGYRVPRGTQVTCNVWAIHRHPREFPEPDAVRPERFLDGGLGPAYPNGRGHNAFGWGRRQCSGQPLAEQSLVAVVARLLWAFRIRPGLDGEGREVELDIFAYNDSENMRPLPFKARFEPRSERIAALLREEAAEAAERLREYDGETKLTVESVLAGQRAPEKPLEAL